MTVLSINDLCYEIDGRLILDHINASVEKGELVVITGHNGSGKSTLLKLIHATPTCYPGKASALSGAQKNSMDPGSAGFALVRDDRVKQIIKFGKSVKLHQNINDNLFCGLTIAENFKLIGVTDLSDVETLLGRFKSAPQLNTTISLLSGGERQRLALYMRLLMKPDILLLDEHTSALDPEVSQDLMQETLALTKQNNITCIMITHDIDLIHNTPCTRWEMESGRLTVWVVC